MDRSTDIALGGAFNSVVVPGFYATGNPVQTFPGNNSIQSGPAALFKKIVLSGGVLSALDLTPLSGVTPVYDITKLPKF